MKRQAYLLAISFMLVACTGQLSTRSDGIVLGVIRTLFNIRQTYVIGLNGKGDINVQLPADLNSNPEWSPDGKWIISSTQYQVARPEDSAIYLMASDGIRRKLVVHSSGGSFDPTWSPDGARIAYYGRGNQTGIYILNIACMQQVGQNCSLLATLLTLGDSAPDWSPDGKQIAYERGGNIFTIDTSGNEQPDNLTPNMQYCRDPKWSPDGERMLFSCYQPDHFDIIVVTADGSNLINLTKGNGSSTKPQWSPDGRKIAFISDRDGLGKIIGMEDTIRSNAIFIMNSDGSNVTRLSSRDDEHVLWFAWLPSN